MSGKKKFEITPKSLDHGKWYQELLLRSGMIDYTDVSGCYVLKPWAYSIWEKLKSFLNAQIVIRGVDNAYFPMLVSETNLQREADHLEDFAPEVAWISTDSDSAKSNQSTDNTADDKADNTADDMNEKKKRERFAIRPTSETIIYPHFSNWMKETGQYPKINQWCNILRWETKDCTPFIRSREFLWQEGHTCHPDRQSAIDEMWDILNLYRTTYEKLLAVPVIPGHKTKSETFPGAEYTSTIEGFLPDSGRAIQAATSHYLGLNFSKIFDIRGGNGELVHQNSWGFTTRSIGIAIMTHSDDKGLVLPPRIAPIQVVMIACGMTKDTPDAIKNDVNSTLIEIQKKIREINIVRCLYDNTPGETPGMKFNKWEIKGVPIRLELGPRDLQNDEITVVRRDTLERSTISLSGLFDDPSIILGKLNEIHNDMIGRAEDRIRNSIVLIDEVISNTDSEAFMTFISVLRDQKLCLIRTPSTNENENDNEIDPVNNLEIFLKQSCLDLGIKSTKSLCYPTADALRTYGFDDLIENGHKYLLYGRSY